MSADKSSDTIQRISEKFSSMIINEEVMFQKTQDRLNNSLEILSGAIQNQGDFIESQKKAIKDTLSKRLMTEVGLGVFASKTIKVVNEEIERHLSAKEIINPFENIIHQNREEISEILEKTKNNIVSLTNTTKDQILNIISTLLEHNSSLKSEITEKNNELKKANESIANLKATIVSQKQEIESLTKKTVDLQNEIKLLESQITKLSQKNIQLMTSLENTKQALKEAQKLIESMGAGEIKDALQREIKKNEELKSELADLDKKHTDLSQKYSKLLEENTKLKDKLNIATIEIENKSKAISELEKDVRDKTSRIEQLEQEIRDFQERWNRLYNLAEHELNFRIYFMIEDKGGDWVELNQISKALGIPRARVAALIKQFADSGLVEISGNKARAVKFIRPEGSFV